MILNANQNFARYRSPRSGLSACVLALVVAMTASVGNTGFAATLPEHRPIALLIVADEVNPHRLNDADLTQPQDLAPALTASDSPLLTSAVATVNSQCADAALAALASSSPPDVVLYFAHRAAKRCDGSDAQTEFTNLLEQGLQEGIGVVVLHHGWYVDFISPGAKDSLLNLLGASTNSIAWDTTEGQRVFNVGGAHFVTSNGLRYTERATFAGVNAVAPGTYPYFVNVPDELYADTTLLEVPGETRTPLFASDSQGNRLLGYALTRPGWRGRVVAWQPGEYQPNALDDRSGPNFQILVNALYYAVFGEPTRSVATGGPIEEVEVIGQRPLVYLREEISAAENSLYLVWNDVNDDDRFDVHCVWRAPLGTLIKEKQCVPRFVVDATGENARDFFSQSSANSNGGTIATGDARTTIQNTMVLYQQKMQEMILQNPELREAVLKHAALLEELEQRKVAAGE